MLDKWIKFITFHERLILVLAGLVVLYIIGHHWIDRSYDTAVAKNAVAQQQLQDQIAKNAKLEQEQEAREQQYAQLLDSLTKQNQTLVSGIVARNQAVQNQQTKDTTLAPSDLALRHESLLGVSSGVESSGIVFQVSPLVELQTVQKLESLPALEQNVKDQQSVIDNKDKQIDGLNGVVTGLNGQVSGCKAEVSDSQKACDARVKLEEAKARKSSVKWAKIGAAVGAIVTAIILHH